MGTDMGYGDREMATPAAPPPLPMPLVWLLAARPKTLPAAAAPVVLGTLLAAADGRFHPLAALCALLGALLIQIGTNFVNDAADFERGADTEARKGPMRAVAAGYVTPRAMKAAAALAFGLAFVSGLYLIARGGWPILALGLASIGAGVAYTVGRYALAYTGLADLFVLVFFGPVAVGGTYYVQALELTGPALLAGFGPGFIATALLVANNVRDVEEDRAAHKRTLAVRFGRRFGVGLYAACMAGAALVPFAAALWTQQHLGALLASGVAAVIGTGLTRTLAGSTSPAVLNPLLGKTALLLAVYSLVFGLGWWVL